MEENIFANFHYTKSDKLDGENYVSWKFKLQTLLKGSNLWRIVSGDEAKPQPGTGTGTQPSGTGTGTGTQPSPEDWEKREEKALVLLRMSVKDNIIPYIRGCTTSKETWDTLENLYEIKTTERKMYLKSKLFSIKMEENENISSFISRIKDLKNKLADIDEVISDPDLVTVTLNGLLDEYQMFITALAARERAPIFEELARILMQEEERRSVNQKSPNSDLALVAKVKQAFEGKQWEKIKDKRPQN